MIGRIKRVSFYNCLSDLSKPIADATHQIPQIKSMVVEIETEDGTIGQSNYVSFHYCPNGIVGALKDIGNFVVEKGFCVNETRRLEKEYEIETEYFGNTGLNKWALGAVNVAMWDAWCKILGQPIWKVFGGSMRKIPVYGSGGWLSYSEQELIEEVTNYKKRGFQAVKIKVGSPQIEEDIARLTKVREAVGPELKIMMDANQGLDVPDALKLAKAAGDINIHWFEEPIVHTDFDGYKIIREKTGISIAMGEREYDTTALKELIKRNALDLWQPDILRLGGVDGWLASAHLANEHNIPVLPHYFKDYDVPLLATIKNGYGAESFDWIDSAIDNTLRIENGYAYPREGNGWGFTFKPECLEEIK